MGDYARGDALLGPNTPAAFRSLGPLVRRISGLSEPPAGAWDTERGLIMPGHWTKQKPDPLHPNWQTWETDPCTASVTMGTSITPAEITAQLQHANQQLELQSQYPGRRPHRERTNVISFERS